MKVIQMGKYIPSFLYESQVWADHYSSAVRSFDYKTAIHEKIWLAYDENNFQDHLV